MSKNKHRDKLFHETIEREYKRLRAADSARPPAEVMGEIRGEHYPYDGSGLSDRAWRKAIADYQKFHRPAANQAQARAVENKTFEFVAARTPGGDVSD